MENFKDGIWGSKTGNAGSSNSFWNNTFIEPVNNIAEEIKEIFEAAYGFTTVQILDKVYKQPFPNRFLASFAPFRRKRAPVRKGSVRRRVRKRSDC